MKVKTKLRELGLVLPGPMKVPPGFRLPFAKVRIRGKHAYVAGHHALNSDGSLAPPFGKVGAEVTVGQAYQAARLAALAMLSDLKRELGDLDRVSGWLRVFGMVNSAPGFDQQPNVIDGFSDLILEVYGPEVGRHARSAVGMEGLLMSSPVEVEVEVEIDRGGSFT
jgi:hypothetical protein